MVTRCQPCGVERIGSRSPGALELSSGTESTAPRRNSPRPHTASPYPTMLSLPSRFYTGDTRTRCRWIVIFFFFSIYSLVRDEKRRFFFLQWVSRVGRGTKRSDSIRVSLFFFFEESVDKSTYIVTTKTD